MQNLLFSQAALTKPRGDRDSDSDSDSVVAAAASVQLPPPGMPRTPSEPAQAWLSSLSCLYSQAAARLQDVLIKIKLKKEEAGRGCQRTGEAC